MSNIFEERPQDAAVPHLTSAERRALRARAHELSPVVMIGEAGLSEAILAETDHALSAHGLIKVRIFGDDRSARESCAETLCAQLACALVQSIGKLLILWRKPVKDKQEAPKSYRRRAVPVSKKLAAVGKTPQPARARVRLSESPAIPTHPARIPGLARRAGPGIRSARGAINPNAQPRSERAPRPTTTTRKASGAAGATRATLAPRPGGVRRPSSTGSGAAPEQRGPVTAPRSTRPPFSNANSPVRGAGNVRSAAAPARTKSSPKPMGSTRNQTSSAARPPASGARTRVSPGRAATRSGRPAPRTRGGHSGH